MAHVGVSFFDGILFGCGLKGNQKESPQKRHTHAPFGAIPPKDPNSLRRPAADGRCPAHWAALSGQAPSLIAIWVWVKVEPPGIGPQVLVHVSTYEGSLGTYFLTHSRLNMSESICSRGLGGEGGRGSRNMPPS